jgi:hypothetical protein
MSAIWPKYDGASPRRSKFHIQMLLRVWNFEDISILNMGDAIELTTYLSQPGPAAYIDYSDEQTVCVIQSSKGDSVWCQWRRSDGAYIGTGGVDRPCCPGGNYHTTHDLNSILKAWKEGRASALSFASALVLQEYILGAKRCGRYPLLQDFDPATHEAGWKYLTVAASPNFLLVYAQWRRSDGLYVGREKMYLGGVRKNSHSDDKEEERLEQWGRGDGDSTHQCDVFPRLVLWERRVKLMLAYLHGDYEILTRVNKQSAIMMTEFINDCDFGRLGDLKDGLSNSPIHPVPIGLCLPGTEKLREEYQTRSPPFERACGFSPFGPNRYVEAGPDPLTRKSYRAYKQCNPEGIHSDDVPRLVKLFKEDPDYRDWSDDVHIYIPVTGAPQQDRWHKFHQSHRFPGVYEFIETTKFRGALPNISQCLPHNCYDREFQCAGEKLEKFTGEYPGRCRKRKALMRTELVWMCSECDPPNHQEPIM